MNSRISNKTKSNVEKEYTQLYVSLFANNLWENLVSEREINVLKGNFIFFEEGYDRWAKVDVRSALMISEPLDHKRLLETLRLI